MISDFKPEMSANLVMMLRAELDGAIWLVDDPEEGRFYERAAHETGRVVPAFGTAIEVLRYVKDRGVEGVLCIPRKKTQMVTDLPLFWPDLGDVASLLLKSRGADRVLGEIGGAAWLTACGREVGQILTRAAFIANVLERLSPDGAVSDDCLADVVDWTGLVVDWSSVMHGRLGEAPTPRAAEGARALVQNDDLTQALLACDGTSVVRVLAAATRHYRPRGIQPYRSVAADELFSLLRTGFDLEEIEKDGLYWGVKEWEWINWRYPAFRQWRRREPFNLLLDQSYIQTDLGRLAGSGIPFAAIQLDLDHFKSVNENLSHIEGDEAIRLAERVLAELVGRKGESYRRGGDELVAILVGVAQDEVMDLAERLRRQIEVRFREWAQTHSLALAPTASIGVVYAPERCLLDELIRQLEDAQAAAKRNGKNRVEIVVLSAAP